MLKFIVGKTSVIDLEESPQIINNNYRQALQKFSGLLLSEESTPLLSLGYRGLDPHRAQFTQILKDGIPIHADMFGYPEAYYMPLLQTIERIDFIKGGGALLYGPQPGGVLNFVSKEPDEDAPLTFEFENSFGSDDLFFIIWDWEQRRNSWGIVGIFIIGNLRGFAIIIVRWIYIQEGQKSKFGRMNTPCGRLLWMLIRRSTENRVA